MTTSADARRANAVCCDVPLLLQTRQEAAQSVLALASRGAGGSVHLCNAYVLALARRDPHYRSVLSSGTLNFPDGMPVAQAAIGLHPPIVRRPVRGPDLMRDVLAASASMGLTHFLYGGSPETLARLLDALHRRYGEEFVAGSESPPYRDLTEREFDSLCRRIRESGAALVWVGIGTPRQDWLVDRLATAVPPIPAVVVAVGAAFDFLAGSKPEAPRWLHGSGFEWLFRLASEPRRLWRRYLFGGWWFLSGVVADRLKRRHV